jgi:hypothetical protein
MQTDLGDRTPIKGRMLVHKYSTFKGNLYAAAGAVICLVAYRGSVAIVEDEFGNRFPTHSDEVFFGEGNINIDQSVPLESSRQPGRRKPASKQPVEQTPMLF